MYDCVHQLLRLQDKFFSNTLDFPSTPTQRFFRCTRYTNLDICRVLILFL